VTIKFTVFLLAAALLSQVNAAVAQPRTLQASCMDFARQQMGGMFEGQRSQLANSCTCYVGALWLAGMSQAEKKSLERQWSFKMLETIIPRNADAARKASQCAI
jgi:hypothetical protein